MINNTDLNSTLLLERAVQEADRLHFKKALSFLEQSEALNDTYLWNVTASRIYRGLYLPKKALIHADQALALADPETREYSAAIVLMAKASFALGHIRKAEELMEKLIEVDPSPSVSLNLAGIYSENGYVGASARLLSALHPGMFESPLEMMDCIILQADTASFLSEMETAFEWYEKALESVDTLIPENWRPLRSMLIYQSMADSREQMEDYSGALYYYKKGEEMMQTQARLDKVSDLSGYMIEFLISYGNCFGNCEEFEKAQQLIEQAEDIYENQPPCQPEYFKARLAYMKGLLAMNQEQDEEAVELFDLAARIQKALIEKGQDKPEHLARTRYYLARLLDDELLKEKLALYTEVIPVFEQMKEKDPSFYLLAIAEIWNECGRLLLNILPDMAADCLKKSIDCYLLLLKEFPDDMLARESLCIARINLINACESFDPLVEDALKKDLEKLLDKSDESFLQTIAPSLENEALFSREMNQWLASFLAGFENHFDA